MSQVLKFKKGNNLPSPTLPKEENNENPISHGRLIIDGQVFDGDNIVDELRSAGSLYSPDVRHIYDSIAEAIATGSDVNYDSKQGVISGMDGKWGISDRQNNRLSHRKTQFAKNLGSTFGTDASKIRDNIHYLKDFAGLRRGATSTRDSDQTEGSGNKYRLSGSQAWFQLGEGNKYIDADTTNVGIIERLNNAKKYRVSSDDDRKNWELDSFYNGGDSLRSQLAALSDNYDSTIDNIIAKVKQGNLTFDDNELAILKALNIVKPEAVAQQEKEAANLARIKQEASKYGDYDTLLSYGLKWDDNQKRFVIGENWAFNPNQNYHFNDYFRNSDYYGNREKLLGKVLFNGVLYNEGEASDPGSNLYNLLRGNGGYFDLASKGDYQSAESKMINYWGNPVEWSRVPQGRYSNALTSNHRFQDVTGLYDGIPQDQQLVRYFKVDPNNADSFGTYETKYMILDKNGDLVQDDVNINNYTKKSEATEHSLSLRDLLTSNQTNSSYNGRYITESYIDPSGNPSGVWAYVNPTNPEEDVILHIDNFASKVSGLGDNADIKLPKEIAQLFLDKKDNSNRSIFEQIAGNRQLKEDFTNLFTTLFKTGAGRVITYGAESKARIEDTLKKLGFNNDEINQYFNWWKSLQENDRQSRITKHIVYAPTDLGSYNTTSEYKHGGAIEKLEKGNMVGSGATFKSADTVKTIDKVYKDTDQKEVGDGQGLTKADWLDLGALATDVAALGLSLTQVGAVAGATTGAAGSLSRFGADVTRDGFQWSDAGNLLLNLGMDAATALPILGSAAKASKTANLIRKSGKTLLKAFALWGVGDAATMSLKKIINGDKWTIRDLSTVANGLNAGVSIGRSGLRDPIKTRKTGNYKDIEINYNGKGKQTITNDEIKEVLKERPQDQIDALAMKITDKYNAGQTRDQIKVDDVRKWLVENSGLDAIKTKFSLGHEGWKPTMSTKTFAPEETTEVVLRDKSNNPLVNWFNGRSKSGKREARFLNLDAERRKLVMDNDPEFVEAKKHIDAEAKSWFNDKIDTLIKRINARKQKITDTETQISDNKNKFKERYIDIQTKEKAINKDIEIAENKYKESLKELNKKDEKLVSIQKLRNEYVEKLRRYNNPEARAAANRVINQLDKDYNKRLIEIADKLEYAKIVRNSEVRRLNKQKNKLKDEKLELLNSEKKLNKYKTSLEKSIENIDKRKSSLEKDKDKFIKKEFTRIGRAFLQKMLRQRNLHNQFHWFINRNPKDRSSKHDNPNPILNGEVVATPNWTVGVETPMFQNGGIIKMQTGNTFEPRAFKKELTFNNQFNPSNYQNPYRFDINNTNISLNGATNTSTRQSVNNLQPIKEPRTQLTLNNQFNPNNYQNPYRFNVNNTVDISLSGVTSAAARQSRSNWQAIKEPQTQLNLPTTVSQTTEQTPIGYTSLSANNESSVQDTTGKKRRGNGYQDTQEGKKYNPDPSDILNIANGLMALSESHRQYNNMKNLKPYMPADIQLSTPRIVINAGDSIRRESIPIYKPTTSDGLQTQAMQNQIAQARVDRNSKANLADSQQYAQQLLAQAETINKNRQLLKETADRRGQIAEADAAQKAAYKNQMLAQNSVIRNQMLGNAAYKANQAWTANNQIQALDALNNQMVNADAEFNKVANPLIQQYNAWAAKPENINTTTGAAKMTFEQWLSANGKYDAYNNAAQARARSIQRANALSNLQATTGMTPQYARGGRLYNMSPEDRLVYSFIEQNKLTSKFISDLTKFIMQLNKR